MLCMPSMGVESGCQLVPEASRVMSYAPYIPDMPMESRAGSCLPPARTRAQSALRGHNNAATRHKEWWRSGRCGQGMTADPTRGSLSASRRREPAEKHKGGHGRPCELLRCEEQTL